VNAFCGDSVCHARIQIWLADPADDIVRDPCQACLETLAAMFDVPTDGPPTLVTLHAAVAGVAS
jgi:hypothetical protein